jgi:hypothetical protein
MVVRPTLTIKDAKRIDQDFIKSGLSSEELGYTEELILKLVEERLKANLADRVKEFGNLFLKVDSLDYEVATNYLRFYKITVLDNEFSMVSDDFIEGTHCQVSVSGNGNYSCGILKILEKKPLSDIREIYVFVFIPNPKEEEQDIAAQTINMPLIALNHNGENYTCLGLNSSM